MRSYKRKLNVSEILFEEKSVSKKNKFVHPLNETKGTQNVIISQFMPFLSLDNENEISKSFPNIPKEIQKIIASFLLDCEVAMVFPQFYDRKLKIYALSWCAARNNCLDVLKWTQSKFGNFPHLDQNGNGKFILLIEALKSNNIKILDFIFEHSSISNNLNLNDEKIITKKETIVRKQFIGIIFKNDCDIDVLNFLVSKLNINKFASELLDASVLSGSLPKLKWLTEIIEKNININVKDYCLKLHHENNLHLMNYAVQSKNIEMVQYLLTEFELQPSIHFDRGILFAKALLVPDNIEMLNWLHNIKHYSRSRNFICWRMAVRVPKNIKTFKWLISQNCLPTNRSLRFAVMEGCHENFKYLFDDLNLGYGDDELINSAILGRNMKIVDHIMMKKDDETGKPYVYPNGKCYASALKSDRYILFAQLLLMNVPKSIDAFENIIKVDNIRSNIIDAQKIIRHFEKLRAHDFNFSDNTFSHAIAKCIRYPHLTSILDWLLKNNCPFTWNSFSRHLVIKTGEEKFYIIDWMIKNNLLLNFPEFDFRIYF